MIDSPLSQSGNVGQAIEIKPARPGVVTHPVVFIGPFALRHRFGLSVMELLAPKTADGTTAMVPNHGGRTESEGPAFGPYPPANIHVISSDAKDGIKAADGFELFGTECHIASWNVLGFL